MDVYALLWLWYHNRWASLSALLSVQQPDEFMTCRVPRPSVNHHDELILHTEQKVYVQHVLVCVRHLKKKISKTKQHHRERHAFSTCTITTSNLRFSTMFSQTLAHKMLNQSLLCVLESVTFINVATTLFLVVGMLTLFHMVTFCLNGNIVLTAF